MVVAALIFCKSNLHLPTLRFQYIDGPSQKMEDSIPMKSNLVLGFEVEPCAMTRSEVQRRIHIPCFRLDVGRSVSLLVFWGPFAGKSYQCLMQIATRSSSPTTKSTNIVFCKLTIQHMTDANETLSTPVLVPDIMVLSHEGRAHSSLLVCPRVGNFPCQCGVP
jgi:hypothetical protein